MFFAKLVEGNEKFFVLLFGALAVYVQDTTYIADQPLKTLIIGVIGAAMAWLTSNSEPGTAAATEARVAKVEAKAEVEAAKTEAKAEVDAAVVKAAAEEEVNLIEENAP